MAVQLGLADAIGDALIALVEWARPRIASRVDEWVEKVAETVRPDPPMTIRTLDGQVLTGLLVCDAGQVIMFLGTRNPASTVAAPPPAPRPDPRGTQRYDDGSIPMWARDLDPRDLRDLEVDPYRHR